MYIESLVICMESMMPEEIEELTFTQLRDLSVKKPETNDFLKMLDMFNS